jgi:hypothetical protein
LNDLEESFIPTKITFDAFGLSDLKFKDISAGLHHTIALDFNNNIWINLKILS